MEAFAQHEIIKNDDKLPVFFGIHDNCKLMATHWHEHVEILYQLQGQMSAVVQSVNYLLNPGDMLIVNGNELHRTKSLMPQTPYLLIQISFQRLQEMLPSFEIVRFENFIPAAKIDALPELKAAFWRMRDIYLSREGGWSLLFMAKLYEVLYLLYQNFSRQTKPAANQTSHRDLQRIVDVMKWVQENYTQKLSLSQASEFIGVSREHFCRIFRKYTGQTFLDYLNCYRASRVQEELQISDENLSTIMENNGVTNYKVFMQTFREMYGATPRQLRYKK